MKKTGLLLMVYLFGTTVSFSKHQEQIYTGKEASEKFSGTSLVRITHQSNLPAFVQFSNGQELPFEKWENWCYTKFKLPKQFGFKFLKEESDKIGFSHTKFQQTFNGNPIENAVWIIHTKAGKVISMNGLLYNEVMSAPGVSFTESDALTKAKLFVGAEKYKWEIPEEENHLKIETKKDDATYFPKGELVYINSKGNLAPASYRLCYKFNVYAHKPLSRSYVYVDAFNGQIVNQQSILHDADVVGTAVTAYSGTQTMTADSFGGGFRLRESGRGDGINTYNMQTGTSYGAAVDFTDTDNFWNNVNPQMDEVATDAHWGAEMTYDYYFLKYGRNSIDGAGFALNSYVHYDAGFANAFWDGNRMTYGDGDGTFNPLTALDIAGHEITHGLTSFTANLTYADEPGALNESFSDIFGVAVEWYGNAATADWLMGEDIGVVIRSMSNPSAYGDPDTYFGTNWAPLGGADNGGVHTNSGVQNFWFYLMVNGGSGTNDNGDAYAVTGLGLDDAGAIAFRNLTVYLTPSSEFADARFYAIQSAIDLFGACTPEVETTTNAWYAVGVGVPYVPNVVANFSAPVVVSCSAPFTVDFTNESVNASTFEWSFGDGGTSLLNNPVHTYNAIGTYDVQLIADGGACGIDTILLNNFITIDTTIACIVILPTDGAASLQTACSGTVYDSGGPTGDYGANEDASVTITPLGAATIDLTFVSFDVEPGTGASCNYDYVRVYDGPSTSSTLIGTYCNNNIPTTVSSTGGSITLVFHSDGGVENAGFQCNWNCNLSTVPPAADFVADVDTTCDGVVNFTDLTINGPMSWTWNFGDGGTSNLQNPTYTYAANGTYTVVLTATNTVGSDVMTKVNYIVVNRPTGPVANDVTVCTNSSANLSTSGPVTSTFNWYDVSTGGAVLGTGTIFSTPVLTSTTNYYVEEVIENPSENIGPVDNTFGGGGYFTGDQHMKFTTYVPLVLKSVLVYANGGGNRTIELRNSSGTVLQSLTVNVPNGSSRVNLNFELPVGTNLQLGTLVGSSPNLYRNNGSAVYPYTLPGKLSITGTSATVAGYYYFFYDWEVQEPGCTSLRTEVTVNVDTVATIDIIEPAAPFCDNSSAEILSATSSGGVWSADCGTCINSSTGVFNPMAAGAGTHEIIYTISGTCADADTANVVVETCFGLNELSSNFDFTIMPNPANEEVQINVAGFNENYSIAVLNSLGQQVIRLTNLNSATKTINLEGVERGVYLIELTSGNQKMIKRLIRN